MPNSTNYKLGQHDQAINDIKRYLSDIDIRFTGKLDGLEKKFDDLNIWRWKIAGIITALAMGGNVAVDLILKNL